MADGLPAAPDQQRVDDNEQSRKVNNNRVTFPEDGHEWNKYGQKHIRNINKMRSYFKCKKKECRVKKKVEWSPPSSSRDPSSSTLRVVYEGTHTHPPPQPPPDSPDQQAAASSTNNQYNLAAQVFGSDP